MMRRCVTFFEKTSNKVPKAGVIQAVHVYVDLYYLSARFADEQRYVMTTDPLGIPFISYVGDQCLTYVCTPINFRQAFHEVGSATSL